MSDRRRWLVPALIAAGASVGLWLVITDDGSGGPAAGQPSGPATEAALALEDASQASVEELSGLRFPEGTTDFLTAELDDDSQLDITAVVPAAAEEDFVAASALPNPVEGRRTITHSSPLWELNPGGTVRSASDTTATGLSRAVELVDEDGAVRVRAVITPHA